MQSEEILKHISIPDSKRDLNWEKQFLKMLPHAYATVLSDEPQQGPDNWPYLLVEVGPQSKEPVHNIISWLSDKGIGLVVNPSKTYPDYMFSYGLVWNFKERGEFYTDAPAQPDKILKIEPEQKIISGPPHPTYLPDYVKKVLAQFFLDQGIYSPKILVVGFPEKNQYDLCFSIESLGSPPEKEHAGILEAFSWFLPAHYSLALMSEKSLPGFIEL